MNNKKQYAASLARLIPLAILVAGVVDIAAALRPQLLSRYRLLDMYLPYTFFVFSKYFTLLSGFLLILLSQQLLKRKALAFYLAIVLLVASGVFHVFELQIRDALVAFLALLLLLPAAQVFTVKHDPASLKMAVGGLLLSFSICLVYGTTGFYILERRHFGQTFSLADSFKQVSLMYFTFQRPDLVARTRYARWFLDSIYVLGGASLISAGYYLIQPLVEHYLPGHPDLARAQRMLNLWSSHSQDYFKIWPPKSLFVSPNAFLAYRVYKDIAVVLADPVGQNDAAVAQCLDKFKQLCSSKGWQPIFWETTDKSLPLLSRLKFKSLHISDEAVIDLDKFDLDSPYLKDVRNSVTRLTKLGHTFQLHAPPHPQLLLSQLAEISRQWLTTPGRKENYFACGVWDTDYVNASQVGVIYSSQGQPVAFATLIPPANAPARLHPGLDLLRRLPHCPNGTSEFLVAALARAVTERGATTLSLAQAPLRQVEHPALKFIQKRGNSVFSFAGLTGFKRQFHPQWQPRYLVYASPLVLPRVALAIINVMGVQFN